MAPYPPGLEGEAGGRPIACGREGSVSSTAQAREFREDASVRLLVLDTKAGGVGLTLTAATAAAMAEFPWTWADVGQATDRAYGRVNGLHGLVMDYLIGNDAIDRDICSLLMVSLRPRTRRAVRRGRGQGPHLRGLKAQPGASAARRRAHLAWAMLLE